MATELEISKNQFYSDYKTLMEVQKLAIEDARFLTFAGFLNDMDIYDNPPFSSRYSGIYKNGNWSLLGYCSENEEKFVEEELEESEIEILDAEGDLQMSSNNNKEFNHPEYNWNYTIFNGFFNSSLEVVRASKADITKSISDTVRFIEMTFDENLINDICEARELQDQIIEHKKTNSISRIDICIVTDFLIDQENLDSKFISKKHNLEIRFYYWDLKKYNDLKRSKQKRLPITIDFANPDFALFDINYISKKINENLSYYLAIFPAKLIADLYSEHRTQLLENNVRVFLQKKTANLDMRKTISDDPQKFFSYNNGISATAESVITNDGKIIKINDFQIVNGGQTTATLDFCNKALSLEDVFVAVKITSLSKDKNYSDIVSKISLAANTQTAVKKSDFESGKPILVDIERLSRRNVVLDDERRSLYYFFERMAGQYNVTRNNQGNERKISIWEKSNPKALAFDKIDVARWYNAMHNKPYLAAEGAEKQFKEFMSLGKKEISINEYKSLLGFGLLFNRIKKLCGTANGKIYPSLTIDNNGNHAPVAMSTSLYAISYLHILTDECFDYWGVYENKFGVVKSILNSTVRTNSDLDDILVELIERCWEQILHFGGASAQEKTKDVKMWELVKENIIIPVALKNKFKTFLISKEVSEKRKSKVVSDEYEVYFEQLNELLKSNGKKLFLLQNATSNLSAYKSVNLDISNFIVKLNNGYHNLPKNKTSLIFECLEKYKLSQYNFDIEFESNNFNLEIDFNKLYKVAFLNSETFISSLEELNLSKDIVKQVSDIIEKLHREYGLSLNDFKFIGDFVKMV